MDSQDMQMQQAMQQEALRQRMQQEQQMQGADQPEQLETPIEKFIPVPSEEMPQNFPVTTNGRTFFGLKEYFNNSLGFQTILLAFILFALIASGAHMTVFKHFSFLVEDGTANPSLLGNAVIAIIATILLIVLNMVLSRFG